MSTRCHGRPGSRTPNGAGERGAALLGAIVITAIVVALTASIGQASRFSIASTSRLLEVIDADDQFAALEHEARAAMIDSAASGNSELRAGATSPVTLTHNDGRGDGSATLVSAQGLFNLNNLVPRARTSARGSGNAGDNDAGDDDSSDADGLPRGSSPAASVDPGTDGGAPPQAAGEDLPTAPAADAAALLPAIDGTPVDSFQASSPEGLPDRAPGGMSPGEAPQIQLSQAQRRQQIAMLPAAAPWLLDQDASTDGGDDSAPASADTPDAPTTPADAARARTNRRAAVNALNDLNVMPAVRGSAASTTSTTTGGAPVTVTLSDWEVSVIRFSLLLTALGLEQDLLPAILDWVDADNDTRYPGGAEDDYYMDEETPYRAANRSFSDVSELRLVRGIDAAIYEKLRPYVTVLPLESDIDINHAPAEVLMALGPGIDQTTAEMLIESRTAQPYMTLEQFVTDPALAGRPVYDAGLAVDATWFRLGMQARSGDTRLSASALLARNTPDDIETVSRRRGYLDE